MAKVGSKQTLRFGSMSSPIPPETSAVENSVDLLRHQAASKENPKEAYLRKKGMPHYDMCGEMFLASLATGDNARSSGQLPTTTSSEEDSSGDFGDEKGKCKRKRKSDANFMSDSSKVLKGDEGSRVSQVLEAVEKLESRELEKETKRAAYSVDVCKGLMNKITGISYPIWFAAYKELTNSTTRKIFVGMEEDERALWLSSLI